MIGLLLATFGCGSRAITIHSDAGQNRDSAAIADSLGLGGAFEGGTGVPDSISKRDVEQRDDSSSASSPDLAAPDVAADSVFRDASPEGVMREVALGDIIAVQDGSSQDQALDVFVPDVVSADGGSPEAVLSDVVLSDVVSPDVVSPDAVLREVASDVTGDAIFSSIDGPLAAFCSGDLPRMVVNGVESHPAVTGRMIPFSCCLAGEFVVVTQTFVYPIVVMWQNLGLPSTSDLASLPSGRSVQVSVGCDPISASCSPAPDSYTSGLQGVLQLSRATSGYDMSLCLHVEEPAGSPHPIVHTLDLYAPHIQTN
jgi:hypothetical protein